MKKAIVSVLLGNYDNPKKAPNYFGWDNILFTDMDIDKSLGWKVIKVNIKDPLKDSRYYKWMTHETLPDYDLICYMDASMQLRKPPLEDELWFKHQMRNNVKDEAKRVLLYYPSLKDVIHKQLKHYDKKGFNDDYGLYQNGFFVRRHDKESNRLCKTVYDIVKKFSHRDQLALPYALYLTGHKLKNVVSGNHCHLHINLYRHL